MNQFRSEGADKYPTTRAVTLRNTILFYCNSFKKPNLKTRDRGPSLESFMHYQMTCGTQYSWDAKTECRIVMNIPGCSPDTTPAKPHLTSTLQQTKNETTNVLINITVASSWWWA